jgi:ribosome-associated heat shock protein Hsp15
MEKTKVRIDKYLWSIRLFKTRTLATTACDKGRVKLLGADVKASREVKLNDVYEVKTEAMKMTIQVIKIIPARVAYTEAIVCYLDLTSEEEKEKTKALAASFYTGKRLSKVGRPTKEQRRDLDDFMNEEL